MNGNICLVWAYIKSTIRLTSKENSLTSFLAQIYSNEYGNDINMTRDVGYLAAIHCPFARRYIQLIKLRVLYVIASVPFWLLFFDGYWMSINVV